MDLHKFATIVVPTVEHFNFNVFPQKVEPSAYTRFIYGQLLWRTQPCKVTINVGQ